MLQPKETFSPIKEFLNFCSKQLKEEEKETLELGLIFGISIPNPKFTKHFFCSLRIYTIYTIFFYLLSSIAIFMLTALLFLLTAKLSSSFHAYSVQVKCKNELYCQSFILFSGKFGNSPTCFYISNFL